MCWFFSRGVFRATDWVEEALASLLERPSGPVGVDARSQGACHTVDLDALQRVLQT